VPGASLPSLERVDQDVALDRVWDRVLFLRAADPYQKAIASTTSLIFREFFGR